MEDRAYYHPESYEFASLTPQGETLNQLPVVGYVFGELTLSDTLKNPDSYAWFADLVSR